LKSMYSSMILNRPVSVHSKTLSPPLLELYKPSSLTVL
jgi:hypothetical protein